MHKWILALALTSLSLPSFAEQFQTMKDIEVHYSAFNSTFLTPQVAHTYQLTRNGYSAILNISVLDRSQAGKPAIEAQISGNATNLVGNSRNLNFKKLTEGDAIYYLAEFPITNEENLTFNIDISAGNKGSGKLRFNQKFFVEK